MDGESVKQAAEVADKAAQHGSWLSEVFFALGAGVTGWLAAVRTSGTLKVSEDHPLVAAIREEGAATRKTFHEEHTKSRDLMHTILTDLAVIKDRRNGNGYQK